MKKQFNLNGVDVELSKEKLQDMLKEFDKKTIEFKINKESDWDYFLNLYIDGEYKWDMRFNKKYRHTNKLSSFNELIEIAIREYGGEENYATQEDMNNEGTRLYGIDLYNIYKGGKIIVSDTFNTFLKYQYICYSKSKEPIKDIAKALEPVADYIIKAFRGE